MRDETQEYQLDGLEKYQHFATGLMFAIAAAAIQSAKLDHASRIQSVLEIGSWALLITSALLGLFSSRAMPLLMSAQDAVTSAKRRINKEAEGNAKAFEEINEEGNREMMDRGRFSDFMRLKFENAIAAYNKRRGGIKILNTWQIWLFTCALLILGLARAIPAFHQSNQSSTVLVTNQNQSVAISK